MIRKEKLLKQLELLENFEKRVVPLLNKHISSSLFFSELKGAERNSILEKFQGITVAQEKHIEILGQVRDEILKGKKDVY